MARDHRRLAAVVSADVVGYSRLMGEDESGTLAALKAHQREFVAPRIAEHGGRIVKTMGDGLLLEFPSAVDAVRCALDVQRGMAERNAPLPQERRILFRIGINVGDVIIDGDDIFGDGVNVAARLQGLAEPGGICVSREVRDHLQGKLGVAFDALGPQEVKNIARAIEVYRVLDAPAGESAAGRRRHFPGEELLKRAAAGRRVWGAVAGALVLGGIVTWGVVGRDAKTALVAAAPIDSLAVLPLVNLSGDPAQEYFADGMTEALTAELSHIGALKVISRTSVMPYKGAKRSLPEIARALGVTGVVEGSVLRDGDQVKITVQLIAAPADRHLWAQEYVREMRNVLALQSDVARAIATQVRAKLTPAESAQFASARPVDPKAYDFYLRGKVTADRGEATARAVEFYRQATAVDPTYGPAWGALAYTSIVAFNWGLLPREIAFPQVERAAQRAFELDPEDVDSLKARSAVLFTIRRDYASATMAIRRITERAPNDAEGHNWLSQALSLEGKFDEAVAEARRAVELDPRSVQANASFAWAYRAARRWDECIEQSRRTVALGPDSWMAHWTLMGCLEAKGRHADAAVEMQRVWNLSGEDPAAATALVTAEAKGGYPARLRSAVDYVSRMSEKKPTYWGDLASYHALLGERDRAFANLERAYRDFDGWMFMLQDYVWDSLRDDPRWRAILERQHLEGTPMARLPSAPAPAAR